MSANGVESNPPPRGKPLLWYVEANGDNYQVNLALDKVLFHSHTEYQDVQIITTRTFGKTLVLDGKTQSTLHDESAYHESLVQPAMLWHPAPKKVFIAGAGELSTSKEVLRHTCVESLVCVDLDESVVKLCMEHLPEWHGNCFKDERMKLHFQDAHQFLKEYDGKFDVIILDLVDPTEHAPAFTLYTQEFYELAATKLNPNGVLVTQSGACSTFNFEECFTAIHKTLAASFKNVAAYRVEIPSFASSWGFNIAYNETLRNETDQIAQWEPADIDQTISKRLGDQLKFYDGIAHRLLFSLPKPIRQGLENEKRTITLATPVFMN